MLLRYVILIILGVSIFLASHLPQQDDFALIVSIYTIAFGAYLLLISKLTLYSDQLLIMAWSVIACSLTFTFPNLSDDIYRFYWDGMIVDEGISPYHHLPAELIAEGRIENLSLYGKLNSPEYYSVYPPINQFIYWLSYRLSGDILSFSMILKSIYLIVSAIGLMVTMKLLPHIGIDRSWCYVFYLNPLVLIEGLGNLHIEIVMVSLLGIGLYFYHAAKGSVLLPLFYALSLGVKLVPLLISPFLWFHQPVNWRKRLVAVVIIFTLMFFSPVLIGGGLAGFSNSLDLYFRKFEFNGGIYYILRFIGYQIKGYNLIAYLGPGLGLLTLLSVIWFALKEKGRDIISLVSLSLVAWTMYLMLSTTVHPWYIMPLIFLGMLAGKWYPVLWSYFIMWTYINYDHDQYAENLWVVGLEYGLILIAIIYEFRILEKIKSLKG